MKAKWAVACAVPIFGVLIAFSTGCSGTRSQVKEFQRMDVGEGPGDVLTHLIGLQKESGDQSVVAHPPPAAQGEGSGVPSIPSEYPSDVSTGGLSMSRDTGAMHDVMPAVPPLGNPPLVVQTDVESGKLSTGVPVLPAKVASRSSLASAPTQKATPQAAESAATDIPESSMKATFPSTSSTRSRSSAENTPSEKTLASTNTTASPMVPGSPPVVASQSNSSGKSSTSDENTQTTPLPVTSHMTMKKTALYKTPARETGSSNSTHLTSKTENEKSKPPDFTGGPDYRIGPEDLLHVDVWGNVELTGDVLVRPDGIISMPLIQDIKAEGLTSAELSDRIREKLTAFLKEPTVSVIVKQVNASKFFIIGYVARPGIYPLRGEITVLQAISLGGGFTQFASPKKIRLVRTANGKQESREINYYDIIEKGGEGNYILKPGDTLVIP